MRDGNEGDAESASREAQAAEELQPVNVDLNLVSNLLESYASQHGMPGPAGNLAGMLGIKLPDYAHKG